MTIDLETYKLSKEPAQRWFLTREIHDVQKAISVLSTATSVPTIVVAFWIGELIGWNDDILDCINRLMAFYGYKEIKNKPESYPL